MTEWTESMVSSLREGWLRGDSAAQIGRDIGVTKSAVTGKVQRLGDLPPRASPLGQKARIISESSDRPAAQQIKAPGGIAAEKIEMPTARPAPAEPSMALVTSQRSLSGEGCRWPLWGFREDPTHRYCGEPRIRPERPYCATHWAMAFASQKGPGAA